MRAERTGKIPASAAARLDEEEAEAGDAGDQVSRCIPGGRNLYPENLDVRRELPFCQLTGSWTEYREDLRAV